MRKLLAALIWLPTATFASWQKVEVPNTKCGDGSGYHVFVDGAGPTDKLALIFMGGGACWDEDSCFGSSAMTTLNAVDQVPGTGGALFGGFEGYRKVFFPYCNGDVFAGTHSSQYGDRPIHHWGKTNVKAAFATLSEAGWIGQPEQLLVYGYSAGALGGLIMMPHMDKLFSSTQVKIMVADAPGLHFGRDFWHKFPHALIDDYAAAMGDLGLTLSEDNGNLGGQVNNTCDIFKQWKIAFLQGSRDIVMSQVFGNISPGEHERLIFGRDGMVKAVSDHTDNCSLWVPRTIVHTFLISDYTANWPYNLGISAMNFFKGVGQGAILLEF